MSFQHEHISVQPVYDLMKLNKKSEAKKLIQRWIINNVIGAKVFYVLFLLNERKPSSLCEAREILRELKFYEIYPESTPNKISIEIWINVGSWMVQNEWNESIESNANLALRFQYLSRVREAIETTDHSFESLIQELERVHNELSVEDDFPMLTGQCYLRFKKPQEAFKMVKNELFLTDNDTPRLRMLSNEIFSALPQTKRVEILIYKQTDVLSFGISPIEGEGFLIKKYNGFSNFNASELMFKKNQLQKVFAKEWDEAFHPIRYHEEVLQWIHDLYPELLIGQDKISVSKKAA